MAEAMEDTVKLLEQLLEISQKDWL